MADIDTILVSIRRRLNELAQHLRLAQAQGQYIEVFCPVFTADFRPSISIERY